MVDAVQAFIVILMGVLSLAFVTAFVLRMLERFDRWMIVRWGVEGDARATALELCLGVVAMGVIIGVVWPLAYSLTRG